MQTTSPAKSSVLMSGGSAALPDPADTLVLLLDQQSGQFQTVKDIVEPGSRRTGPAVWGGGTE
jgi:hypothetical protein